jgi:hypothetical protein
MTIPTEDRRRREQHGRVRPVFLDGSGTRHRVLTGIAATLGLGLCAALVLLVLAFAGAAPASFPGFPQGHPVTDPPSAGTGEQAGGALPSRAGPTRNPTAAATTTTPAAALSATASDSSTKPGRSPSHPVHPSKSR